VFRDEAICSHAIIGWHKNRSIYLEMYAPANRKGAERLRCGRALMELE
jgi:hypothetical protein